MPEVLGRRPSLEARTTCVSGAFLTILRGRPDYVGPAPQDEVEEDDAPSVRRPPLESRHVGG
jgi:hypothetical protein